MKCRIFETCVLLALTAVLLGCRKNETAASTASTSANASAAVRQDVVPTICVYAFGKVSEELQRAMMDSLRKHYPQCRFAGHLPLPDEALTSRRKDHKRYRADLLNRILVAHKTKENLVIGLTQADIGLDDFRGRPHSGIMGLARGVGAGVAVFSSYRPRDRAQLFSVMFHELGHAQGLRHCPDAACLMQNANGGNPFGRTHVFCEKCRRHMEARHWRF
ncbi:MAG: matrixin family metalloprotease [Alloprevotella sp.]